MRPKKINMIVDLQFGSTGKGLFAGFLALRDEPDTVVAAWGPNAGHTFISEQHGKMVNIALPNGIISPKLKRVLIGPGSVIDPKLLESEMDRYAKYLDGADIMIHAHAAVVTEMHRQAESTGTIGIGSTMKGVGEAMIQKIRRNRASMNIASAALMGTPLEGFVVDSQVYQRALAQAGNVLVEGCQGYSLSINHGFYPYTTSRDCTKWQMMMDCALPGKLGVYPIVYGVARTYPIRVANRYRNGEQVGWSGPGYPDQKEIQWKDIGIEPELTTVTQLPRRIFTYSRRQVVEAVQASGVDEVFLNFCNYDQGANGAPDADILRRMIDDDLRDSHCAVTHTGWGPGVADIKRLPGV